MELVKVNLIDKRQGIKISKQPLLTFFMKTVKGLVGFFGVFIVFPVLIAWDCFHDDEWVWSKIDIE